VLPTACQAVEYAEVPDGEAVLVLDLGPIGEMCARIAQHRGAGARELRAAADGRPTADS
jgi:hypothetical protein